MRKMFQAAEIDLPEPPRSTLHEIDISRVGLTFAAVFWKLCRNKPGLDGMCNLGKIQEGSTTSSSSQDDEDGESEDCSEDGPSSLIKPALYTRPEP